MKVTPEDVENFFEALAKSAPSLISYFSSGESIDTSEGKESFPHFFLEKPFVIREIMGGENGLLHAEVYSFAIQIRDRVEDMAQYKAIESKCKNIASYCLLKIQKSKFGKITQAEHLLGKEDGGDVCAFDRVELEITFDRWVEKCDLNEIFIDG